MLIQLLIVFLIVGFILWLVSLAPIPPVFKQIAYGVAVLLVTIWLLQHVHMLTAGTGL